MKAHLLMERKKFSKICQFVSSLTIQTWNMKIQFQRLKQLFTIGINFRYILTQS